MILSMLFISCATHVHSIGYGPQTGVTVTARQYYLLYGLVPLNTVDINEMAGKDADGNYTTNYDIKTQTGPIDILLIIGLGIVTLGIGCLPERVDHGKTGYIAKNINEFVNYTIKLFNNDDTWSNFRNNLIKNRGKYNWSMVAKKLIENFK